MKCVKNSNLEIPYTEKNTVNNSKLENNITRAKSTIFELAYCNEWQYFFTGTLSPEKYDRTDLEKYIKDFGQFLRNTNRKYHTHINYIFIPELHKDLKSWHLHGFVSGIPPQHISQFTLGRKMSSKLASKVADGDLIYCWDKYSDKFGFCDLEPIKNAEAVSKYVTKYITKDLSKSVTEIGAHLYYCSQGLNRAKDIKKGHMSVNICPDFSNDYCSITWLPYSDELLNCLKSNIYNITDIRKNQQLLAIDSI